MRYVGNMIIKKDRRVCFCDCNLMICIANRASPSHSIDTKAPSFSVPGDAR